MNGRGAIWVALFLSVVPAAVSAQPDDGADPDEGGEAEPKAKDDASDAAPAASAPTPAPPPPAPEKAEPAPPADDTGFSWAPFGYLRMQYRVVQNDPNVEFVGRDDGFELQNARVGVRGKLDDLAAFVISFDGAVDERAQLNDPEGQLRVGLRDAFVDVVLGSSASLRVGFFRTMFDPEALIGDTARLTIDRPIESRGMRATEGYETPGLTPGRSPGAAIRVVPSGFASAAKGGTGSGVERAGGSPVGFELAVQNGADEFSANNDNDKPSVSGTVITRLAEESWLVGSGRYNPRSVGGLPFRQDEDDIQAAGGIQLGAGPVLFNGGFVLTRTSYPTTGGPSSTAIGGHGQLMIRIPGELPLAFGYRFGLLDPSSLIVSDRVMEHTAAGTLGVPRLRMRLQLQLTHVAEQSSRALSNSRAQLAAEFSL